MLVNCWVILHHIHNQNGRKIKSNAPIFVFIVLIKSIITYFITIILSDNIFLYDEPKMTRLTQRWLSSHLFVIYKFKEFIVLEFWLSIVRLFYIIFMIKAVKKSKCILIFFSLLQSNHSLHIFIRIVWSHMIFCYDKSEKIWLTKRWEH